LGLRETGQDVAAKRGVDDKFRHFMKQHVRDLSRGADRQTASAYAVGRNCAS
jgi:hypothetical protein